MKIKVRLVKAFTSDPELGNPAGVVVDANNMTDEQMLRVAQHYGFSESVVVQNSTKADFRLRFFSVKQEVDFCGHATVAAFFSLMQTGSIPIEDNKSRRIKQETRIGILPVTCYPDRKIMMTQKPVQFIDISAARSEVAKLLRLHEDDLSNQPIQVVSTGVNKLIVPVGSIELMRSVKPNLRLIVSHGARHNYSGIAVVTTGSFTGNGDLAMRNFNPAAGIDEDPATGIAAGPLAHYANKYFFNGDKTQVRIEQGFDMGMGSVMYADIKDSTQVGGYAANFGIEELEI